MSISTTVKKSNIRTKRKQAREANDSEADALIKDFLVRHYIHNEKTRELLEEYLDSKNSPSSGHETMGSND